MQGSNVAGTICEKEKSGGETQISFWKLSFTLTNTKPTLHFLNDICFEKFRSKSHIFSAVKLKITICWRNVFLPRLVRELHFKLSGKLHVNINISFNFLHLGHDVAITLGKSSDYFLR